MSFYGNKKDAVQFASETFEALKPGSQLIMIMRQGLSEDCSVSIVTATSSEDIVKTLGQACYDQLMSTS